MNLKLTKLLNDLNDSANIFHLNNLFEMYESEFMLNEGLIYSADIKFVVKTLNISKFKTFIDNGKVLVSIKNTDDTTKLFKLTNNLGYYPAFIYADKLSNKFSSEMLDAFLKKYSIVQVIFEPKYDQEIENMPPVLYHLTRKSLLGKILKKGLIPKTTSKTSTHPERIYLAYNKNDLIHLSNKFVFKVQLKPQEDEFVILKINTSLVPEYFQIFGITNKTNKTMQDPNFKNKGVYTLNSIPPYAIEVEMLNKS